VDAKFLFHSSTGAFPEEQHSGIPEDDDPNVTEPPLSHLRSCQSGGEDGVCAGQIIEEGESRSLSHTLPLLLIYSLSSEVPEYRAGLREEGSGMTPQILLIRALTSP
jgi:hypothetical protein